MANAPDYIISLLEEGIQASRMKSAGFMPPGRSFSAGAAESKAWTEQVRETTRIYRETWVEGPLMVVLAYLKGDIDARQAEMHWLADTRRIDQDVKNPRVALGLDE